MAIGLCLSGLVRAGEAPRISVKAELNRAFITIGDPVEYTVTIRHDPILQILSEVPPPAEDILTIKKIEDLKRKEAGLIVEGRQFTLTAFRLGEFILDPVKIQYRTRNGKSEPQTLETDRLYLTVKSVAAGELKTDIRGIKPVLTIPRSFLGFGILLFVLGAGTTVFFIHRHFKRRAAAVQNPEPLLSPEEEALLHLNRLFDSDWIRQGKIKEYYLRLSEILRSYLEKRFQILAAESTTMEINRSLRQQDVEPALREKITEVLEACDLAKFAKWKPEPPQIIQINQKSKQLVELARPREVAHGI